ncbi:MAG: ABC transporter permease [Candidatus Moranbacteria bacterium]|nr:ABC transporter permease [Candidatus Moranbacteria bacterium]
MRKVFLLLPFVIRDLIRARTIFFMVVISLSVASVSVLSTSAILSGFQEMLSRGARGWLGDIVLLPSGEKKSISHAEDIRTDIKNLQYVESVSIRGGANGVFQYQEKIASAYFVVGVDKTEEQASTGLPNTIVEGEFLDEGKDSESVIIGFDLADVLLGGVSDKQRIPVGSDVTFLRNDGFTKSYRVKGIMDAKNFVPNSSVLLQRDETDKLDIERRNSSIIVKLSDINQLEHVRRVIKERHPEVTAHTWLEESGYIEGILEAVRYITLLITYLLIVSVFIIISIVIFINVSQKKRQIGIMKSMGVTNGFIISIYTLEAALYFSAAYTLGIGIFLLIHRYSVAHPIAMPIGDFYTALNWSQNLIYFLILLFASLLGGFVPSWLAAKRKIIDALRSV